MINWIARRKTRREQWRGQNDYMHNLRELPAHRQETYLQQMRNKNYLRRNARAIYRVLPFFH